MATRRLAPVLYNSLSGGAGNVSLADALATVSGGVGNGNVSVGALSLVNNVTGENNTVIGLGAGAYNVSGSRNVFIGNEAGLNELGSDKLYIANSNTSRPLIKGDFAEKTLQLNAAVAVESQLSVGSGLTVNGTVTAREYLDLNGNKLIQTDTTTGETTVTTNRIVDQASVPYVRKDSATGAVHIGTNSFVFEDAALPNSNGRDTLSSSVGKLQIGKNSTDRTYFIGGVHVPKPTAGDHATTRSYVDASVAMAAAMDTRLPASGKRYRLSLGYAKNKGQDAVALNFVGVKKNNDGTLLDWSARVGHSPYAGSMGGIAVGFSF